MFTGQSAFLNASGPFCGRHDAFESGTSPTCEEIKLVLEQTLPSRLSKHSTVDFEATEDRCSHK